MNTWNEVLTSSLLDLWQGIINFIPDLVVALIIFLVGVLVGSLLGKAVAQIVKHLKVDAALKKASVHKPINRAGFNLNTGRFIGGLVKWFIIIAFLVASLDVLGLTQVNSFLEEILFYLPNVFVAVLILLVAAIVADFTKNLVRGSARAAGMRAAHFLGTATEWSIWVFGALAALLELGVATTFIQTLFTGIVVAISLAIGLSFGLGGRDHASRYLDKLEEDMKFKKHNK